ncbi:hypothetical protein HJC23_012917 [Cyclotella cryptica]|uniref:Bacterial bifunctional deaminase-reductase C-terminal domain-containing protein n=1 Tax=Cyclotella cryptica TaxID=29204 RepID=A0ABD3Q1X4_9STRA
MKASVYIATTLDGFIASHDGSIGFLNEYQKASPEDGDMGFSSFLASVDLIVMGRKTWDQVVSFGEENWPYGKRAVWVWSRVPESVFVPECRRGQAVVYSLSPDRMMELAKEKGHSHIYIDGGTTIRAFHGSGFVDEYILSRLPLLLGGGIPLFENSNAGNEKMAEMDHLETKSFSNGIVQSHYRVKR